MVAKSDINRIEFNEITQARIYAYEVGKILESKLGKMQIEAKPFTIDGAVQDNFTYELQLQSRNVEVSGSEEIIILTYTTGSSETVDMVLEGLSASLTENDALRAVISLELGTTNDNDKSLFVLPKDGIIINEISSVGVVLTNDKIWTESATPACYLAYGKQPKSTLPRVVIEVGTQNTMCNLMEESTTTIDGVDDVEFTSSYLSYTMLLRCEAGNTQDVLRTGNSSQSILNFLRKSMTNEIIWKNMQNALNSVCYPIESINPLPRMEFTQYEDVAQCVAEFTCVDMFIPTVTSGIYDTVIIGGDITDPEDESGFKYQDSDDIIIEADVSTITAP